MEGWLGSLARGLKRLVGVATLGFGLIAIGHEIDNVAQGKTDQLGIGLFIVLVFVGVGSWLLWSSRSPRALALTSGGAPAASAEGLTADKIVLKLARAHRGRITPNEVAAESTLSFEEARATLEEMVRTSACRSFVAESGILIYHFPEFEGEAAKREFS